jgi:hypothetical protein
MGDCSAEGFVENSVEGEGATTPSNHEDAL